MTFSLDQFRLDGKVAIVTGAGGRPNSIGEAYCRGLSLAGASVVAADLSGEGAQAVAARLTAAGGKAIGVQVDITQPDSVTAMAKAATDAFGGVDILVNNAAIMAEMADGSMTAAAMTVSLEQWNIWFAVNLTGALLCARAVVPSMVERGGGRIVNQVSGGAFPAATVYGITKIALVGLTTTLARELGPRKIAVNAIAPGMTASGAGDSLTPPGSPFRAMMDSAAAMRGQGAPDDLIGALLLLCSPAGDWISGQVLHVDGGWILRP
jgi:NAD(P)-dependent dehydrogenase (short-subunit alcohol dehydrogenase family)